MSSEPVSSSVITGCPIVHDVLANGVQKHDERRGHAAILSTLVAGSPSTVHM